MPDVSREELWKARVDQWRESGLSQRAFALLHGFPEHQVGYWVRRLGGQAATPALLPVSIKHVPATAPALSLRSPSGWTVALPASVPASWLAELLRGL